MRIPPSQDEVGHMSEPAGIHDNIITSDVTNS